MNGCPNHPPEVPEQLRTVLTVLAFLSLGLKTYTEIRHLLGIEDKYAARDYRRGMSTFSREVLLGKSLGELLDSYGDIRRKHNDVFFWEVFFSRLRSCPNDARLRHKNDCILHLAMAKKAPPHIVKQLIAVHPVAITEKDVNGEYPYKYVFKDKRHRVSEIYLLEIADISADACLYLAVTLDLPPLLDCLVKKHPKHLSKTMEGTGKIPLHFAAEKAWSHRDMFLAILEEGKKQKVCGEKGFGGLFKMDNSNHTPLEVLLFSIFSTRKFVDSKGSEKDEMCDWLWNFLEKTAFEYKGIEMPALHASIDLDCPYSIIRLILTNRPSDAYKRDSLGRFPVAIATSKPHSTARMIEALIERCPKSAIEADETGRLPLHHFLDNKTIDDKWSAFRAIVEAEPDAIYAQDPITGMHPALLAAVDGKNNLDTIYVLLRNAPFLTDF